MICLSKPSAALNLSPGKTANERHECSRRRGATRACHVQSMACFTDYSFLCIGPAAISPNDIDTWIANFGLELEYSIAADIPE